MQVDSDSEEEPKVQPRKVQQPDEDDENALDFSDLPEKDSDGEQEQEEADQDHGKVKGPRNSCPNKEGFNTSITQMGLPEKTEYFNQIVAL